MVPLLAATLLCGCSGTHLAQGRMVTQQATARLVASSAFAPHSVPDASAASGYVLTVASTSPSLATTAAVLTQVAKDLWQTTVIVSRASGECPGPARNYWLETTSPDLAVPAFRVTRVGLGPCRVMVTFKGPLQIPGSASLVLDEAGVLSSTQLSLNRDVTLFEYLGVPAIFGAVMMLVLLLLIGLFVRIYDDDGSRILPLNRPFWGWTISVSKILKVSLISVVTILGTFLGTATLANSLFPGVSLSLFAILSIAAGIIAAAGSAVYVILYDRWIGHHPVEVAGTTLALESGSDERTTISVPSGARIELTGSASITPDGGPVIPGVTGTIQIPNGSDIEILREVGGLSWRPKSPR